MDTKKLKVFVARQIPEIGIEMLKKHFDVKVREESTPIPREELIKEIKDCEAVLVILNDKMDAEIMDANPKLKIISNFGVGYDNIKVDEATKRGIKVGNTPGVLTQSTAEHALALLMAIAKRVVEGDKVMREDKFPGWNPTYMLGMELYEKTIGIIGYGRIGKRLAEMLHKAFNCKIIYADRSDKSAGDEIGVKKVSLDELLHESDIVSLHVPLCPETIHMIGENEFKKMKKTALFINTARGPIVDESALLKALQEKTIAGAAIDVFEKEPHRLDGLEKYWNLVMTPHTASATNETRNKMSESAAQNIIGVLVEGQKPVSIVNL